MIDRIRLVLLSILILVALASGTTIVTTVVRSRIDVLSSQITHYERQISMMRSRAAAQSAAGGPNGAGDPATLGRALAEETSRYYRPRETSLYAFSSEIQGKLEKHGLSIARYRPVTDSSDAHDSSLVEFVVQGNADALIGFLRDVANGQKYKTIRNLTIQRRAVANQIDATFRIGYEEIPVDGSQ